MLAQIGVVPDRVTPADLDETPAKDETPRLYAQRLAREKASAIAAPGSFTLAADTVVALGRRILPKADDPAAVRTCLKMLSGRRHQVLTAIVLVAPDGSRAERLCATAVAFARLSEAQLDAYAASGEGIGKAGGYAIQGRAAAFTRLLTGSYSGVVGLPLFETGATLARARLPGPMKILAACSPGEVQVACVSDGVLLDFALWRPGRPDGVGDVHRARVIAHVPGLAGAFLALAGGDGFLPDSEGGAGLVEGALVTVRITRAGQGGKGPRLSAKLPQTEGETGLVARGPSPLAAFAEQFSEAAILTDDQALVAMLRPLFGDRVSFASTVFPPALTEEIAALAEPLVDLPGGLRASVHPTPAMVAIDVDMAAGTGGRQAKASAQLAANLAAIPALVRQLRLRNLSGAILIDPAGISIKRRTLLRPALEAALAMDPLQPRLIGFTGLGLVEILRPRWRPPLHELLAGPHAAALAALRALARDAAASPQMRFGLTVTPAIAQALETDADAIADLVRRTGRPLMTKPDPTLSPGHWQVGKLD